MANNLMQILEQAPIDMRDLLLMRDKAHQASGSLLLAGCSNAGVLALLEGLELGHALANVQKPCVVEVTRGLHRSIHLTCDGEETICTSMEDLSQRLLWTSDKHAFVRITGSVMLPGWDRMIFAILDGMDFRTQLNQYALGCGGAIIVLDAIDAPAAEVYHLAAWLHEACGLQDATAALFCGACLEPNQSPAMVLAMNMKRESLPVVTCSMDSDSIRSALETAASFLHPGKNNTVPLERETARCALERLVAEKQRISNAQFTPKRAKLSLADRFTAQIPGSRNQVKALVSAEFANRLNTDVREFSIFLQHHMEELLAASISELEEPKSAMRAFAHSYLSDVLSQYCHALLYDMVSTDIAPKLLALYHRLFDDSWISRSDDPEALPQNIREAYQIAINQMKLAGQDLLDQAVSFAVKSVLRGVARPLAFLSGLVVKAVREPIRDIHFALTSAESYARQKAMQLQDALNTASASYQALIQDDMLPQLQAELLHWFDERVRQATERLQDEDTRLNEAYEQQLQAQQQQSALLAAISATEAALTPFVQVPNHQ